MLKRTLLIILILLISVTLGWAVKNDAGYILISYHHWSIETSLWFGSFSILLIYTLTLLLFKLLKHFFLLPTHLSNWTSSRKRQSSELESRFGLCEILEANWKSAELKLSRSAIDLEHPLSNYLGCAYAAQQQCEYLQRDEYLNLALSTTRGSEMAIELFRVQLEIQAQQYIQALTTLQSLVAKKSKHNLVLKLLAEVYLVLEDWPALVELLPTLSKRKVLTATELETLCLNTYSQLLISAHQTHDTPLFETAWSAIPSSYQYHSKLLGVYCEYYLNTQDLEYPVSLIEKSLKREWNPSLLNYYGSLIANVNKQLKLAESWLNQHPQDAELLLCLGRLSIQAKLWGKAQDYFRASINLNPQPQTYWALAQVQEQLNLRDEAQQNYKKGLSLFNS